MRKCDTYEEVAAYLLERFAAEFGLDRVEGKQPLPGHETGTTWVVDAKGVRESDGATIIIECRRYTTSKAKQEQLAALAYRIIDTKSAGGIYVSPLGLQEGAVKVAAARNIVNVRLDPESTTRDFLLRFLNTILAGLSNKVEFRDEASCTLVRRQDSTEVP